MSADKLSRVDAVLEMMAALIVTIPALKTAIPEEKEKVWRDMDALMQAIEGELIAINNNQPKGKS